MYRTCTNTVRVDETWFYAIRDREKARAFPGKEKVRSIRVHHKEPY